MPMNDGWPAAGNNSISSSARNKRTVYTPSNSSATVRLGEPLEYRPWVQDASNVVWPNHHYGWHMPTPMTSCNASMPPCCWSQPSSTPLVQTNPSPIPPPSQVYHKAPEVSANAGNPTVKGSIVIDGVRYIKAEPEKEQNPVNSAFRSHRSPDHLSHDGSGLDDQHYESCEEKDHHNSDWDRLDLSRRHTPSLVGTIKDKRTSGIDCDLCDGFGWDSCGRHGTSKNTDWQRNAWDGGVSKLSIEDEVRSPQSSDLADEARSNPREALEYGDRTPCQDWDEFDCYDGHIDRPDAPEKHTNTASKLANDVSAVVIHRCHDSVYGANVKPGNLIYNVTMTLDPDFVMGTFHGQYIRLPTSSIVLITDEG